jgi:hypothetical protein
MWLLQPQTSCSVSSTAHFSARHVMRCAGLKPISTPFPKDPCLLLDRVNRTRALSEMTNAHNLF